MLRGIWNFLVSVGWVAASLTFSAVSIAAVIGLAFLMRLAFPFLPDATVGLAFLLAFFIYALIVAAIGWWYLMYKLK